MKKNDYIYCGENLPKSNEKWSRDAFSRKDLNKLSNIQIEIDSSEIKKRIKSTKYKNFRPKLSLKKFNFELKENSKE